MTMSKERLAFKLWSIKESKWLTGEYVIGMDGNVYEVGERELVRVLKVGKDVFVIEPTGIKDKTGNYIYVGDILIVDITIDTRGLAEDPEVSPFDEGCDRTVVEYDDGMGGYIIYAGGYLLGMENESHRIIGNIFDNPELIEKH